MVKIIKNISNKVKEVKINEKEKLNLGTFMKNYLSLFDTKSNIFDYRTSLTFLYLEEENKIKLFDKASKMKSGKFTSNQDMLQFNEKVETKFINKTTEILLKNSLEESIIDMVCKSFAGSTDIPNDINRSLEALDYFINNNINKETYLFYKEYLLFLNQHKNKHEFMENFKSNRLFEIVSSKNFTDHHPKYIKDTEQKMLFLYSRELFKIIYLNLKSETLKKIKLKDQEIITVLGNLLKIFDKTKEKIYESYYYIGLYYYEGFIFEKDISKSYYYFTKSASKSHSLSLFMLAQIENENKTYNNINMKKQQLSYLNLLKNSAEEGYTLSMYYLAELYNSKLLINVIQKKKKALSWHRQASRNGFLLSYEKAGDLLKDINQKELALSMYLTAKLSGIDGLDEKITKTKEDISKIIIK